MKVGQLVVLVEDVDGVEAGREGCIMGARDDMVTVGCQSRERLHLVLARTWQVLPRELFRRLSAREVGVNGVRTRKGKYSVNGSICLASLGG